MTESKNNESFVRIFRIKRFRVYEKSCSMYRKIVNVGIWDLVMRTIVVKNHASAGRNPHDTQVRILMNCTRTTWWNIFRMTSEVVLGRLNIVDVHEGALLLLYRKRKVSGEFFKEGCAWVESETKSISVPPSDDHYRQKCLQADERCRVNLDF